MSDFKLRVSIPPASELTAGLDPETDPDVNMARERAINARGAAARAERRFTDLRHRASSLPDLVADGRATPADLETALREKTAAALAVASHKTQVTAAESAIVAAIVAANRTVWREAQRRRDGLQKQLDPIAPILNAARAAEATLDGILQRSGQPAGCQPLSWPSSLEDEHALRSARGMAGHAAWSEEQRRTEAAYRDSHRFHLPAARHEEAAARHEPEPVTAFRTPPQPVSHPWRDARAEEAPVAETRRAPVTIDVAPMDFRAAVGSVDAASREVTVVWAAGGDVERRDFLTGARYLERLSMDPAHVDLGRLNASAPLLDSHNADSLSDQLGVVIAGTARVDGAAGHARVRFSSRQAADDVFEDVKAGIITGISVGYRTHKYLELAAKDGGLPIRLAVSWQPYELSVVSMPADLGARVRAGGDMAPNHCIVEPASI